MTVLAPEVEDYLAAQEEAEDGLRWWDVSGSYAMALVAATSELRALELLAEHPEVPNHGWGLAKVANEPPPPAPPTVEGVYAYFAE